MPINTCPECEGAGGYNVEPPSGNPENAKWESCPACEGSDE